MLAPLVLTRLVRPEERVRAFALLSIVIMAGFGLSPVLASAIERAGQGAGVAFHLTALCIVGAALFFLLAAPIRSLTLDAGPRPPRA